jgi:hypothetical protein
LVFCPINDIPVVLMGAADENILVDKIETELLYIIQDC